ncbi:MAG: ZIP family metal transporter [Flavobacteriales bacterium]
MMELWKYSILILTILGTGLLMLQLKINTRNWTRHFLSFGGAYMLALCVFHLFPAIYHHDAHITGMLIMGGFLFQLLLDFISGGIEHGHVHLHHVDKSKVVFPYSIFAGLCAHAFFEGMPLATDHIHGHSTDGLVWGIVFHNVPVTGALTTLLLSGNVNKKVIYLCLTIFAFMTPAGALLIKLIDQNTAIIHDIEELGHFSLAFVIGIFLHISTTILFESDKEHHFNMVKFITIILGIALAFWA